MDILIGSDENAERTTAHSNSLATDDPLFERKPLTNGNGFRIIGKTTPPVVRDKSSKETFYLTGEDLEKACADAVGAPILNNHRVGTPIGRVLSARPDADGRIEVEVELADTLEGWRAANAAGKGDVVGFSWGYRNFVEKDDALNLAVTEKKLVELSITAAPEFDKDALITQVSKRTDLHEGARCTLLELLRSPEGHALFGRDKCVGTLCVQRK